MKVEKKKLIQFRAPESLHRKLRVLAGAEGVTIEAVAASALEHWLTRPRMEDALADLGDRREARR